MAFHAHVDLQTCDHGPIPRFNLVNINSLAEAFQSWQYRSPRLMVAFNSVKFSSSIEHGCLPAVKCFIFKCFLFYQLTLYAIKLVLFIDQLRVFPAMIN